jgi:hypothetical protein
MSDIGAMTDFWEDLNAGGEAPEVLRAHAAALELEGSPGPGLLRGEGEPHVLIVVFIDAAAIASAVLVPAELVDDRLRAALEAIDGRTFAGGRDLRAAQWDAAVLVMAALAAEDVAAYWNRWSGHDVRAWSDLDRRTTRVFALRRAM